LKKMTETKESVVRNGQVEEIPSSQIVPGDILEFNEGDAITADIRLFETNALHIDESSLTGESIPSEKLHSEIHSPETEPFNQSNMLFSGTSVVKGSGKGIVVRTGKETYFAKIALQAQAKSPDTPLMKALSFFSKRYLILLVLVFVGMWIVGFLQGRKLIDLAYILVAELVSVQILNRQEQLSQLLCRKRS